jgi:hypothetical protein
VCGEQVLLFYIWKVLLSHIWQVLLSAMLYLVLLSHIWQVLLSAIIGRDVYLPDDSDAAWTKAHVDELRQIGRAEQWLSGEGDGAGGPGEERGRRHAAVPADQLRVPTPAGLSVRAPWYPPIAEYKWTPLPARARRGLAALDGAHALPSGKVSRKGTAPGGAYGGAYGSADGGAYGGAYAMRGSMTRTLRRGATLPPPERLLLAPPWLISADNALGHRYKGWMYGARPSPCVLLHFVCVGEARGIRSHPAASAGVRTHPIASAGI